MKKIPMRETLAKLIATSLISILSGCHHDSPQPGQVLDEPMRARLALTDLKAADENYFHDMDGGIALTPEEVKGRNTWIVWSGGNDRMWDGLANTTAGNLDFLKTLSSHPKLKYGRDSRWKYLGLVNEPCFTKATEPNAQRHGLWLDARLGNCAADPFENDAKYPGVKVGARAAGACRAAPTMATPRAWSDCDCSTTPISTRPPGRNGIRSDTTKTRLTITPRIWFAPIA